MTNGTYEARGVSPDKPEVEIAVKALDAGLFPDAFCRIIPDVLADAKDMCMALHADGVGSKAAVAHIAFKEFGDASVFRSLAQDSLVMNTDDLLCVGARGPFVVSNTIGRNSRQFVLEPLRELIRGYAEFSERMAKLGIELVLCGGETADLGDLVRTVVIDLTIAVRMPRADVLDCSRVQPNQVIVGLASFGQASYEDSYNSGIGSNGFTSVRHELLSSRYGTLYPETFDAALGQSAYVGEFQLDDLLPGSSQTIAEAMLSPTRTYLPIIRELLSLDRTRISAMFHNTGGGLTKCLKFGNGINYVKDRLFPLPPIFEAIAGTGRLSARDMVRTFNLGQRFEVVCDEAFSSVAIDVANRFDVEAKVIGYTEAKRVRDANSLIITLEDEKVELEYTHR